MSAADKKAMDDSAESAPQNWVVPEVMKPEEKELVEKLTQVMSKNTFHRAKEATRLARSSDAARNEARQAAAEAEAIAAEAASPRPKKKKSGFLCCGSSDLVQTIPVARRVLGESDILTLKMRLSYARALCKDAGATLDDLREAVTTLEDAGRTARRVLGGTHPLTEDFERGIQVVRPVLRARETPSRSA